IWVRAPHKTFVAERDGHVAGTYFLRPNQPGLGSHVCNAGYMVAREYRGQGIGRALCAHSIEQAARLGYLAKQYNLVVATNPALRLWKRMGFEIVGRLKDAFQMPDGRMNDAFVMYRLLDAPGGGDTMDRSES
ncbi:MAG: GNAT family N-acetyltransferase, partial [Rhodothermales bacterium]|nr:GNAT family N-acetyltransferase [Rhodothermales bacterium]